jgi:hypothetical protein
MIPSFCLKAGIIHQNELIINTANPVEILLPFLEKAPLVDGDLSDWKDVAFHDGVWDIYRVSNSDWYQSQRNRLTKHGSEASPENDLQSRYYMAWDNEYLYLGAEVHDNVNDVTDPNHEPKRWYYKDCVSWFFEAPHDTVSESFKQGDNAFCFVADAKKPDYGAWWRHGTLKESYVEERIPKDAVNYSLRMNPWGRSGGDYILEARVNMAMTFARSDPEWTAPKIGDVYSVEIVHTDPDGGDYGGHLILYGTGDNDGTWTKMILIGPKKPIERKPE